MTNTSNTSFSKPMLLLVAFSSTVFSLPYEDSLTSQLDKQHLIIENSVANESFSSENFTNTKSYKLDQDENFNKYVTLIEFTTNLVNNQKDIDSEYVDIINENFWDLI